MNRCDVTGSAFGSSSSLLGQLGLFIFGGRPLQTHGIHCERDRRRRVNDKKT